jgi:hypothetical protein
MLSIRRALIPVLLVAGAVPAVVLAATPKEGYYIDPALQVYINVRGAPPKVKSFQGPCLQTPQGGGQDVSTGGYILNKKLAISKKGKFSYSGKVKLQIGTDTSRVKVKINGKFKGGKAKGTVTFPQGECNKTTFTGKYYGKNPQG